jgi:hypothetical protein
MSFSSATAKQLCTKSELELFSESLARQVKNFDTKALRARAGRARKLRDKYRQLADRQDREARGKQSARRRNPSQGSAQTRKKEQLFAETLRRFDKQLAAMEPPKTKRTAKKVKSKVASKPTKGRTTVKKKAVKSTGEAAVRVPASAKKAISAAKKARRTASGRIRKDKHLSSQGRRKQGRRDAR